MLSSHRDVVLPDVDALPHDPVIVVESPGGEAVVELVSELDADRPERRHHEKVVEEGKVSRPHIFKVVEAPTIAPVDGLCHFS